MTPTIQHYSRIDIHRGDCPKPYPGDVLIQIDERGDFTTPMYTYSDVYQFCFEDTENDHHNNCITVQDGIKLGEILKNALQRDVNVYVHCVAGISRSAGVAVAGQMIGFHLPDKVRQPNTLVKNRILRPLGLCFDPHDSVFAHINSHFEDGDIDES